MSVDISIFGKHIAENPTYPFMTSFFATAILSISRHHTEIKSKFLESSDQLGSETQSLSENSIRKFDLM